MKKLILLFSLCSFSILSAQQHFDYQSHWKQIEKQEKDEGKLKSLLPKVEVIYKQAEKDKNIPQQIKAFVYQSKINLMISDDDDIILGIVEDFKGKIEQAKGTEKAVLQSMLAELLDTYSSLDRYKISERTETEEASGEDFRYWTKTQFNDRITDLYEQSIQLKKELQKEPVKNWRPLLEPQEQTEELRPTLYDFLAHRAINFFSTDNYIRGSHSKIAIDKAVDVYKKLIDFHQGQENCEALVYNKLELLKLKRETIGDEKFEQELTALAAEFRDEDYASHILLTLANFYREKFEKTDVKDFSSRKKLANQAIHYSELIVKYAPKSDPAKKAEDIKQYFKTPDLDLTIKNYISPDQNTPIAVSHKNLTHLYFRVLDYNKGNATLLSQFRLADKESKQKKLDQIFKAFPQVKEFKLDLNEFDDYQFHNTIGKLPALKSGHYLIFVSNNSDFTITPNETTLLYEEINVSPYALTFRGNDILMTNRETGKLVKHKRIDVYRTQNNQSTKIKTVETNDLGVASYKPNKNEYLKFKVEEDRTFFSKYSYLHSYSTSDKIKEQLKFFTDRKIYRPGQTVYFKAIAYTETPNYKREVVGSKSVTIELKNTHGKSVSKQTLKTNEFGSVSGEFVLPTSGITGQYSLSSSYSIQNYYFSVEEYKRPKFEVNFEKIKETYKLNEVVTAKGKANSYSGANISDAKVVYRVYRQRIFPYLPWWRRGYFPTNTEKEEITQGETTTDDNGKFEVEFTAKPSSKNEFGIGNVKKQNGRTYRYIVEADITDLNGETQSAQQTIAIGDLRYMLDISLSDKIEISSFDSIPITTENLNGQFVPAKGEISLTKIKAPKRVLRESPLPETDYELYPKDEFVSYFPHEPYANEDKKENWEKETATFKTCFDTHKAKSVKINSKDWESGYYLLNAYILDGKDTIPQEKLVYLYQNREKKPVDNELFSAHLDKDSYKPGDKAVVTFSSAAKNAEVMVDLEVDGKIIKSKTIRLNNNVKTFKFPIKEDYRGNVFVHYYFGKFNTTKPGTLTVNVPHKDQSLKITTKTFRDKLKPGQDETWEVNISGKDKDKFLAEMLATMYDASLDQFKPNSIQFPLGIPDSFSQVGNWNSQNSFGYVRFGNLYRTYYNNFSSVLQFDRLNWYGLNLNYGRTIAGTLGGQVHGLVTRERLNGVPPPPKMEAIQVVEDEEDEYQFSSNDEIRYKSSEIDKSKDIDIQSDKDNNQIVPRRALQETAFFYPDLRTDKDGNVKIQFAVPESLTEWKFMATAHTKDMHTGYLEKKVITQKELMVTPNPPRFLREGDHITFSSKVTNLSDKDLSGKAKLLLFDAFTMQPIDADFEHTEVEKDFTISQGKSTSVSWELSVPKNHQAVVYRVVASAGNFSDGEENALPILTNRKLVTETLPIHVREGQDKTFTLDKLKSNESKTLDNFKLTFEMTTNPIWQAIFSLPYLREPAYDNSISNFGRLYGNLISQKIVNSNPKIKAVFDNWKSKDQLKSKLEQNQELKELLLEETPWVREAESEDEQMKRIALLFDLNKMQNDLLSSFNKLKEKQSNQGGFPWFDGGNDNRYITTYIVSGLGHLQAMGVDLNEKLSEESSTILSRSINYLDNEAIKEYELKHNNKNYKVNSYGAIQYLYARSMFLKQYPLPEEAKKLKSELFKELNNTKFELPLQSQALLAMVYERYDQHNNAVKLLNSIKDHAVESDEMGMYWKANKSGWFWYEAPIETQALLIEAFDEVLKDDKSVESMKVWLLKNKQTNRWASVKATTEAVYALLNSGKDWMNSEEGISIKIGKKDFDFKTQEKEQQAGSGYVKTSWSKSDIKPEMATVEVEKTSPGVAWGALYWQYFEDLDNISSAETGIKFKKELFLKKNTDQGPVLKKITEDTPIKVGDLVTVRLEIQTDRDMQFVHLKDMRASGFEPTNVISQYKYQDGLMYYESTRDAATNFFMDVMPKGTYVFEYDLRANNVGDFSNGIITLQNMYAPELSAHSKGIRVEINK